jgi:hypothetical protein
MGRYCTYCRLFCDDSDVICPRCGAETLAPAVTSVWRKLDRALALLAESRDVGISEDWEVRRDELLGECDE